MHRHLIQVSQPRFRVRPALSLLSLAFAFSFLLLPSAASAVCPVCTVAVAGGVGLSRWVGIDDTITGLWVGATLMSLSLWTINWLNAKNIKFYGRKIIVFLAVYGLTIWPLYTTNIMGHPVNTLWGIDKLAIGMTLGSFIFIAFALLYQDLKKKNDGHAHFPFEKIVIVVVPLLIASGVFYLLTI